MSRTPRVTAARLIRAVERRGFLLVRQSGSHKIYRDAAGKRLTIPMHAGKTLHPKIIKTVMTDAELTEEDL